MSEKNAQLAKIVANLQQQSLACSLSSLVGFCCSDVNLVLVCSSTVSSTVVFLAFCCFNSVAAAFCREYIAD